MTDQTTSEGKPSEAAARVRKVLAAEAMMPPDVAERLIDAAACLPELEALALCVNDWINDMGDSTLGSVKHALAALDRKRAEVGRT